MPTFILSTERVRGENSITLQREDEITGHLIGEQLVVSNQLLASGAEVVILPYGEGFMVQPSMLDRGWRRLSERLHLRQ